MNDYLDEIVALYLLNKNFKEDCDCKKDQITLNINTESNPSIETYHCHRCDSKFEIKKFSEIRQIDTEADELIVQINRAYPLYEGGLDHCHISELLKNIVEFVRRNHE